MIRQYTPQDINAVLDIWLNSSIKAHDFVSAEFWVSQVDNMRDIYIPASKTYVVKVDSKVVGFYSLYENMLAAIFVSPEYQGKGVGKQLISHAKEQCPMLTLNVYSENVASYQFYLSQGFTVISEQVCEHTGRMEYTMSSNT
ncbi:N-acetyltransferase [Aliivibrio fischeri]|uniref:Orfc641-2 n=1 Tax=Aliivibrio fischeri TaxID=668 RepID=Q84B88_ALIFS|nr:N-acetyltransferase [Aliivibrio fischeri]AAO38241.1 Orfc641-2 [Aliivibrio fischeri]USR97028.1 N-acetyltransferase [Aliivibrio fischeri ATCC 7744 = JCM 18803 = DSM 507]USR97036.1 N-acetyltransferase [Aliivibrio fischeri ATCC 7744 = JCM 18803 = DSM 507]